MSSNKTFYNPFLSLLKILYCWIVKKSKKITNIIVLNLQVKYIFFYFGTWYIKKYI